MNNGMRYWDDYNRSRTSNSISIGLPKKTPWILRKLFGEKEYRIWFADSKTFPGMNSNPEDYAGEWRYYSKEEYLRCYKNYISFDRSGMGEVITLTCRP